MSQLLLASRTPPTITIGKCKFPSASLFKMCYNVIFQQRTQQVAAFQNMCRQTKILTLIWFFLHKNKTSLTRFYQVLRHTFPGHAKSFNNSGHCQSQFLHCIVQDLLRNLITSFSRRYNYWNKCCNACPRWICIRPPIYPNTKEEKCRVN